MPLKLQNIYSILIWLCITSGPPFVLFLFPFHPYKILLFLTIALMTAVLVYKKKVIFSDRSVFFCLGLQISCSLYLFLYFIDFGYNQLAIQFLCILIVYLFIDRCVGVGCFIKQYVYIISIFSFLGLLTFLLALFFDIPYFFSYTNFDNRPGYCFLLSCTNSMTQFSNGFKIIRYSGYFDEPGSIAFFGTFALFLNYFYLKKKFCEVVLVVSLLFTFSLSFFLTIICYYFFFYFKANRYSIFLVFALALFLYLSYSFKDSKDYYFLYNMTWGRLEVDESGKLEGDNRSDLMEIAYSVWIDHPMGIGFDQIEEINRKYGSGLHSNILAPLAQHGIIGFMAYFIFLWGIIYRLLRLNNISIVQKIGWIIILLLLFVQRPTVIGLFPVISLILLFTSLKLKNAYYVRN